MSDFDAAVQITLAHEGGFFQNSKTGEVVNMGITKKFLAIHLLPSTIDDVRNLARPAAINLYRTYFWGPMNLALLTDQTLAAKVFDLGVNLGPSTAAKLFQGAINDEWGHNWLRLDGKIGPATIGTANHADPVKLLAALRVRAEDHYRYLAATDPNFKSDLNGWLIRLAT
jgi:lysozyme family protein